MLRGRGRLNRNGGVIGHQNGESCNAIDCRSGAAGATGLDVWPHLIDPERGIPCR